MNKTLMIWKLNHDGYLNIDVSGKCMEPMLDDHDKIKIYPISEKLNLGDVVLIYSPEKCRIHRIVYINSHKVLTKGDNEITFDANRDLTNILGIYRGRNKMKRLLAILSFWEGKTNANHSTFAKCINKLRQYISRSVSK